MENKQIIINGVDVSGWTDEEVRYKFEKHSLKAIKQVAFDLYKQLKAKEQECEELKEEIDGLKEIIQRHENDNNALLSEFENDLVDYYRRYKECLTEIKEIIENMNNECFYDDFECNDCDMKNGCTYFNKKQILQKISEVEND